MRRLGATLLSACALLSAGACQGAGAGEVGQLAQSFEDLAQSDPSKACDLIAPRTRDTLEKDEKAQCAEALDQADLPDPSPVQSVDVYGHDARVVLGKDVVFLARFPEGWKVTAAGCIAQAGDLPYDCDLSGG